MEDLEKPKSEIETQNIQLVKGEFTPDHALSVIIALIDQKINYHKREGFQLWVRNHKSDQETINARIKELETEKIRVKAFLDKLYAEDKMIKIDGQIKLTTTY